MADLVSQSQYKRIAATAAGTTVLLDRNGSFERVLFNQNQTGTVTFYDVPTIQGTTAATTSASLIGVMNNNVGSVPVAVPLMCRVRYGLVAVTGGTVDFTVIYN